MKLDASFRGALLDPDEGGSARALVSPFGRNGRPVARRGGPARSLGRALVGWLAGRGVGRGSAVELQVEGRRLRFSSAEDFDFCLRSKTHLPAARIPALMELSLPALERQAAELRDTEQRLADLLACAHAEGSGADEVLRTLEPKVFSQDHGWRAIMEALALAGPGVERFCALAMTHYLDYMVARQLVIQHLCEYKAAGAAPEAPDPAFNQTAVFEAARLAPAEGQGAGLRRLARGAATPVRLPPTGAAVVLLSRHRFALVGGRQWYLEDESGRRHALRMPTCLVGRLRSCDAVVPPTCSGVSRRHLLIEVQGPDRALLTDLSSQGTFLSAEALR